MVQLAPNFLQPTTPLDGHLQRVVHTSQSCIYAVNGIQMKGQKRGLAKNGGWIIDPFGTIACDAETFQQGGTRSGLKTTY